MSAFSEDYCIPEYYDDNCGYYSDRISKVSLLGETKTIDNGSECSDDNYGDYTDLPSPDLLPGSTYSMSVSTDSNEYYNDILKVWVDFDSNGEFEDTEIIYNTGWNAMGNNGTVNFDLEIPEDTNPGTYRMRIRMVNGNTGFTACSMEYSGETEDYLIEVIDLIDCEGTPSAGEIVDDFSICSEKGFFISVEGAPTPADGLSRNWQASPTGINNWEDIEGAHTAFYFIENGITEEMDYRYRVFCENGGEEVVSDTLTVSLEPAASCPCIPEYEYGCMYDVTISNVSIIGESITMENESDCSSGSYGDYTNIQPVDLAPGETYTLVISTGYYYPDEIDLRAWIDYNDDGQFSNSEEIANTYGNKMSSESMEFEFYIPETTEPGTRRLRIKMQYYGGSEINPCEGGWDEGETEDYLIDILQLDDCEGTINGGLVDFEKFDVCPETPFNLTVFNSTPPANGLIRIWQRAPYDTFEWTDIEGANSTNYVLVEGISEPTDFRYKLTCTFTGETVYSNLMNVGLNEGKECYCQPEYTGEYGCQGYMIENVTLEGDTVVLDNDSDCSQDMYGDYTDLAAPDLFRGEIYYITISNFQWAYYANIKAWIDFNGDGSFSESELLGEIYQIGNGDVFTFQFTVPEDAQMGEQRMRVRMIQGDADSEFDACSEEEIGETEDYTVLIKPLEICSGTPIAGIPVDDNFDVCSLKPFTLALEGTSDPAIGLDRIWQISTDNENWTDMEGAEAKAPVFTVEDGISQLSYFRYKMVCESDGQIVYSDVITVGINPPTECYCIPTFVSGCSDTQRISNVTLMGDSGFLNNDSECGNNAYSDFTDLPPTGLIAGETYTLNVTVPYAIPSLVQVKAWIDYNNNGFFEPGEQLGHIPGFPASGSFVGTINFTVPQGVEPGIHRLRVVMAIQSSTTYFDACSEDLPTSGETEDYLIEVLQLEDCEGEPDAGTKDQENFAICAGVPFAISVSDMSMPANGLDRTWQSTSAGQEDWTDISGTQSNVYNVTQGILEDTEFRYKMTCNESGLTSISDPILVSMDDPNQCFCIPEYRYPCSLGYNIAGVNLVGESLIIDNQNNGCASGGYSDFTETMPIPDLIMGSTYTLNVKTGSNSPYTNANINVRAWIDFNGNGFFENSEEIASTNGGGSPADGLNTFEFEIPETAVPGVHRIRIRLASINTTIDPCNYINAYGETEDYLVDIIESEECDSAPIAGDIGEDFDICAYETFTLTVTDPSTTSVGLNRIWQSSPAGENDWTDIEGSSFNQFVIENGILEPTDFRFKITCTNTGDDAFSNEISVGLNPPDECYCEPSTSVDFNFIGNLYTEGALVDINYNSYQRSPDGYGNYSDSHKIIAYPGQEFEMSLSEFGGGNFHLRIWADWNHNGSYEETELIIDPVSSVTTPHNVTIQIPSDMDNKNTRLRVRMSYVDQLFLPCEDTYAGEILDFGLQIIDLPDCFPPSNVVIENITTTTATLSWEDDNSSQWNVIYGERGFDPEDPDAMSIEVTGNPEITLTDLQPNAQYDFYVNSICGENDESVYYGPVFLWTNCAAADVPFLQDFEGVNIPELPHCGTLQNLGAGNNWQTEHVSNYGFNSNVLTYRATGVDANVWYYTQGINLEAGINYNLSYRYGNNWQGAGEKLKVAFGANPSASAMEQQLTDHPFISNGQALSQSITFTVEEDGVYYFGFHAYSPANLDYLYVDDISIDFGQACPKPIDLEVDYITENSARVSWVGFANDTSWEVLYGPQGFSPNGSLGQTVMVDGTSGDSSVILTDLDFNTAYDVYVHSICGEEDDVSSLTGPVGFKTLTVPPNGTYICDAIALGLNQGCGDGPYNNEGAFEEVGEPTGSCLNNFHGTNSMWFTFTAPFGGEVTITTDFNNTEFITEITAFEAPDDCGDISSLGNEVGCANNGNDLELTGLTPGEVYYVKVAGFNQDGGDFCIEVQSDTPEYCNPPTDVNVDEITHDSAQVSWTQQGVESQWEVAYGIAEMQDPEDGMLVSVTFIPELLLEELLPYTSYNVFVRTICEGDNPSDWTEAYTFTTDMEPCDTPLDILVYNITHNSAYVMWTPSGDENTWQLSYGAEGFENPSEGQIITIEEETEYFLTDLSPDSTYDIYVRAVCDSEIDNTSVWIGTGFTTTVAVCDEPSNITVSGVTLNSALVTWTPGGDELQWEVGYGIEGFNNPDDATIIIVNNSPEVTLENLEQNTTYEIYVRALCEDMDVDSDWAGAVSFTTEEAICEDPTDITVSDVTYDSALVTWTPGGNESQWEVGYGLEGYNHPDDATIIIVDGDPVVTLENLEDNTTYQVYIRALCEDFGIYSDWVGTDSFTTQDLSVPGYDLTQFKFYPNPVKERLTLEANLLIESVTIYNLLGQQVIKVKPHSNHTVLDTEMLQEGVYMVKVEMKNDHVKTFKIIKK